MNILDLGNTFSAAYIYTFVSCFNTNEHLFDLFTRLVHLIC